MSLRNVIKIIDFEKFGFHAKPCAHENVSKPNLLEPETDPGGSAIKIVTRTRVKLTNNLGKPEL